MMTVPSRRSLLRAGFSLIGAQAIPVMPSWAQEPPRDVTYAEDFDELWRTMGERYCYFGEKTTDWNAVRRYYRPLALAADSRDAFGAIAADVLREVYDAHTHMSDPPKDGPRGPYFDL